MAEVQAANGESSMTTYSCNRCKKELPYPRSYASLAIHHENGVSYSIDLKVGIIGSHSPADDHICEECVKELTKIASRA